MKLNKFIDHTLLKADASKAQIKKLCEEAKEYDFKTVCINPSWIEFAINELKGSDVGVCTVIGFPLGAMTTEAKSFEAADAIEKGASEIDMVLHIGKLKDGDYEYIVKDIKAVKDACGEIPLKVIIETCLLTDEEKAIASKACIDAGADFVKTSTGFSTSGATIEDVVLIKEIVGDKAKIKAAGGVRSYEDLLAMVNAGADRIGTSSGVKLLEGKSSDGEY